MLWLITLHDFVNAHKGYVLFDPRVTHPFVSCKFENELNVPITNMVRGLVISTTLGDEIDIDKYYEGCTVLLGGYELRVI